MSHNNVLTDLVLSNSTVHATIDAPYGQIDVADWLRNLTDEEYQRCAPGEHKACAHGITDDGRPMSLNVEMIGASLVIQHAVHEIAEKHHCRLTSLSDVLTPQGWTTIQATWDLRVTDNGDGTCDYTNSVVSHPTTENMAFDEAHGVTFEDAAAARQTSSDSHNHRETPHFAESLEAAAKAPGARDAYTKTEMASAVTRLFQDRDRSHILPMLSDDVVLTLPATLPYGGEYAGRDAFDNFFAKTPGGAAVWSSFDTVVEDVIASDDHVIARLTNTAVPKATGKAVVFQNLWLFRVAGGRIVSVQLYADTAVTAH